VIGPSQDLRPHFTARAGARAARVYTRTRGAARARVSALAVRCERALVRSAAIVAAAARGLTRRSTFLLAAGQAVPRAQFLEWEALD